MKKKLLIALSLFVTANTFAQIPNKGFENWATCMLPTTYNITQVNESSDTLQYQDSLVKGQVKIFFYKYFSPNGDGIMDLCGIRSQQKDSIAVFKLTVWDLCSTKVFETTDPNSKWDGMFMGNLASKGIYKRSLSCTLVNGQTLTKTDSVQLILYGTTFVNYNYMNPDG